MRERARSRTSHDDIVGTSGAEGPAAIRHEVSGGNPFLLRALLAELGESSVEAEHVRRITPDAVSASVLLRLARLPEGAVTLARAVAILGSKAPFGTASRLARLTADEAAECAGALIRAGILVEDDVLAFAHPLIRSAVYGDLAGPERSRWHHRAAHLLVRDGAAADRVAAQLLQSLQGGERWAVGQLRRAAADAWARGAPDVAATYLRRALTEPPADDVRGEVLSELGQAELVGDPALAAPDLREALALLDDPRRRSEVALGLGNALTLLGRLAEAIPVFGVGLAELDGDERSELRSSLEAARLGAARWDLSAHALRRELLDGMRSRLAAGEGLDPLLHSELAVEATAEGIDREQAVRHARAALSAARRPTDATSALPEAMLVLVFADLADEAQGAVDEWLALARARAWPLALGVGATVATLACLHRGAVSEAVAGASGAVIAGAEIRLAPVAIAFLVQALVERGDVEAAHAELVAHGLDGELPYAWATTPLLLARGCLHAAAGDHAAAIEDLTASGERAETWGCATRPCTPGGRPRPSRSPRSASAPGRSRWQTRRSSSPAAGARRGRSAWPCAPQGSRMAARTGSLCCERRRPYCRPRPARSNTRERSRTSARRCAGRAIAPRPASTCAGASTSLTSSAAYGWPIARERSSTSRARGHGATR